MTTLHLGIDLGATNIKWAVVRRDGDAGETVDRGQVPTRGRARADAVVDAHGEPSRRDAAGGARDQLGRASACRACTTRARGCTVLLTNLPGGLDRPAGGGARWARRSTCRSRSSTTRAPSGSPSCAWAPAAGRATMVGLTLGHRRRRRDRGRRARVAPGPRRHGRRARATRRWSPTARPAPAATAAAWRPSSARIGWPPPAGRRRPRRRSRRHGRAMPRALDGMAEIGAWLGIGIANLVVAHDAGSRGPGRWRCRRRRPAPGADPRRAAPPGPRHLARPASRCASPSSGTWAGAIGAAVHGAERAGDVSTLPRRAPAAVPTHRAEPARAHRDAVDPGARLPSDTELCREFGVSRMTARHAMQRLADEGLVARHPGRGSFVAVPPAHRRADRFMTFSHEMRRMGRMPRSRILERVIRPSTADEAAALGRPTGQPVVVLRRVRYADDVGDRARGHDPRPALRAGGDDRRSRSAVRCTRRWPRAGHTLRRGAGDRARRGRDRGGRAAARPARGRSAARRAAGHREPVTASRSRRPSRAIPPIGTRSTCASRSRRRHRDA